MQPPGAELSVASFAFRAATMPETTDPSAHDRTDYRYWAFISYSHRDSVVAKRLHSRIETWSVPSKMVGRDGPLGKIPARLFPIFLDRDEISGGESLNEVIHASLKLSRYLIVICSPAAAASKYVNEEIRQFKEFGRGARIIYLIAAGDPAGGLSDGCFPEAALYQIGTDGTRGGERLEPIAADARPGKDGWRDACLKVLARLLQVGFDELKLRDLRRRRRARLLRGTLLALGIGCLAAAYLGSADAGLHLPFSNTVRSWLDGREMSVFRPVPSGAALRASADTLVERLDAALRKRRGKDGWFTDAPGNGAPDVSCMTQAQSLSALALALDGTAPDRARDAPTIDSFENLFRDGVPVVHDGVKWGWKVRPEIGEVESHTALWSIIALATALRQRPVAADPAVRARLLEHLSFSQEVLRLYHHDADPGAWDAFPFQINQRQHSVYASTLALIGLSQVRRAGLPWEGSAEARDTLSRQTAQWLIGMYRSSGPLHGWVNDPLEEHVGDVYDGLTAQTYGALMEAAELDPAISLPPAMYEDIRVYLVNCLGRTSDYAVDAGAYSLECRKPDGTTQTVGDAMRYLWWPWVIDCAGRWLRHAEAHRLPMAQRVQVRRSLAHQLLTVGPAESEKAMRGYSYTMAEGLYCLRNLRATE